MIWPSFFRVRPRLTSAYICSKARLGMFIRSRNDAVKSFLASVANLACDLRIGCIEKPSCTAARLHQLTGGCTERQDAVPAAEYPARCGHRQVDSGGAGIRGHR